MSKSPFVTVAVAFALLSAPALVPPDADAGPIVLYTVLKPRKLDLGLSDATKADPLFPFQWTLLNRGNLLFPAPNKRGIDLNVVPAWKLGLTGKGVRVMIVDGGLDATHEDLAANVDRSMLHSFVKDVKDPTSTDTGDEDGVAHGTAMAGILAAVARNGVGGRGVAPGATIGASQVIVGFVPPTAQALMQTYGGAPFSEKADIFSASYDFFEGLPEFADMETSNEARALAQLPAMRGGKGALVVRVAGNEYAGVGHLPCSRAKYNKLTCINAGFGPAKLLPQTVVVASINASGQHSSFSNTGANILVSGLGGDDVVTKPGTTSLGLITTDISGCERGVSAHKPTVELKNLTDFEKPGTPLFGALNARCNYLSVSSGTSSAVPTVVGVIALMLEANPALTWRDIRVILARTSRRVDAARAPTSIMLADHSGYVAEPAWTRNAAGLWFHNAYGYGLVDAHAAVVAAKGWARHLSGPMLDSGWVGAVGTQPSNGSSAAKPLPIPRGKREGAGYAIRVPATGLVEFVQVRMGVEGVNLSDIAVELTSPSGTRSVLLAPYTALDAPGVKGETVFASNAFMSERMDGDWTLRVIDTGFPNKLDPNDQAAQPLLTGWSIRVMGTS